MEVFDQQVALPRPVAEQRRNLLDRRRDKLAPLCMRAAAAFLSSRMRVPAKR